jgi:hypothetical protein
MAINPPAIFSVMASSRELSGVYLKNVSRETFLLVDQIVSRETFYSLMETLIKT